MAVGRAMRKLLSSLLVLNFAVYLVVIGMAGWSLNDFIDRQQNHSHVGGNDPNIFFLRYALAGAAIGSCSVFLGCAHLRVWNKSSLARAVSLATTSCAITMLAFGLVCKQISTGRHRGKRLQTLDAFIGISCVSQLFYLLVLHSGICSSRCTSYGPDYHG